MICAPDATGAGLPLTIVPAIVPAIPLVPWDVPWSSRRSSSRIELFQELHREPTAPELAEAIGSDVEDVSAALAADGCFAVMSLDRPLEGDAAVNLGESLASDDTAYERLETVAMLEQALSSLEPRERRILALRFIEEQTQADIGAEIGVSQMQVSRLLRGILEVLRDRIEYPAAAAA